MKARSHSVATGILVALAAAAASLVLPAGAVAADEPAAAVQVADEAALERSASEFLGLINGLRASRGLPALQVSGELTASAQGWAGSMASTGVLSHDPNLASAASGWTSIGENVGMGPTVSSIWAAFLASPQHLANLTSSKWTHLGVGFVRSGQAMWTTHRFMTLGAATPPPPTAPPATAPPATAPPVTAPPAPVVTAPPAPIAPQAPATVPVAPVTAPLPVSGSGSGSGADGADDGASESIAGDPSAEADRVAEVINALQALPG